MAITKKKAILNAIKTTFDVSSIHSFPNIIKNKSFIIRGMWIICFIISLSACSLTIFKIFTNFFSYEVISRIETNNRGFFDFPMIKICNINPLKTEYAMTSILKRLNDYELGITFDSYKNISFDKNDPYFTQSNYLIDLSYVKYLSMILSLSFNQTERKKFEYSLDEVLISCLYESSICDKLNDFEYYYDVIYGNCFKFNSGNNMMGNKVKVRKTIQTGRSNGLMLELILIESSEQNVYSTLEGYNIFITSQDVDQTLTEGIYALPGFSTNIILEKVIIQKEPEPYSTCTANLNKIDSYKSILFKKIIQNYGEYNRRECLRLCVQKNIEEICNCSDGSIISFYKNKKVCISFDEVSCSLIQNHDFLRENLFETCDCPIECAEINFRYDYSILQYPTKNYANSILAKNPNIISKFKNRTNLTYDDLKDKILSVNIFFNEIKETVITEYPKLSISDMIASIGGIIGLSLGMSFLSFVEIFEIFIKIIFILFNYENQ